MDQHPIPQDVTGFQFKLIGSMTVKQFGYVAAGVIMAVLTYYAPAIPIIIKVLLIPLFGGSGFVVAFLPIEGRPVDVMTNNFIKALLSPNQYIYKKRGRELSFLKITTAPPPLPAAKKETAAHPTTPQAPNTDKSRQLQAFLMASQNAPKTELDKKEQDFLKAFAVTPQAAPRVSPPPPVAAPQPTPSITVPPPSQPQAAPRVSPPPPVAAPQPTQPQPPKEDLAKKELQLEQELQKAKDEEAKSSAPEMMKAAHQKVSDLEDQIKLIHDEKIQLEQELIRLRNQLSAQQGPTPVIPATSTAPTQDAAHVRSVAQNASQKVGLPHVSDTPNVIVGIVKDPRGNVLPNILVEVKDAEKNPVRAFKTNPLGQFASATPLTPGTYTIELEDPKKLHSFDIIEVVANNQILLPLEIISHDAREELRKQLFN